ncbi:hypothetical protein QVD17_10740 [Tagetes erecta]|uniref:Uncharacterized protein n=1 Tax=Tagetes erecta TaxID=13708 RepID=A0AAD8L6D4_TARER|nr:hypothetical protein QVD17_10740 [Tagetes erecta]
MCFSRRRREDEDLPPHISSMSSPVWTPPHTRFTSHHTLFLFLFLFPFHAINHSLSSSSSSSPNQLLFNSGTFQIHVTTYVSFLQLTIPQLVSSMLDYNK